MIHHGDCLDVMAAMEPESVDAIVTDPPYGLEFMGKEWDRLDTRQPGDPTLTPVLSRFGKVRHGYGEGSKPAMQAWHQQWAEAAYRVAKPSAYLLAFGGTRTVHRMTVALEDAGWIIRDMLVWGYASGFPKSKASLKPAWEPIVMARKPGPLRMLAIDECRIPHAGPLDEEAAKPASPGNPDGLYGFGGAWSGQNPPGRWPANIVLSSPIFDGGIEGVVGGGAAGGGYGTNGRDKSGSLYEYALTGDGEAVGYGDSGTYSRFFLIPKSSRADREPVLGGLPTTVVRTQGRIEGRTVNDDGTITTHGDTRRARANVHPTVKPTDLMRHLVRLVTPTGGTVLDPFLGSGTTALAAEMEGFAWIGIEREAKYVAIAEARLNGTQRGLGLEL